MLCGVGFRLSPPVSYTTPLPTSTIGALFTAFFGFHSRMLKVGGSGLPRFTPSRPPMARASIWALSKTVSLNPLLRAMFLSSLLSWVAVRKERGSFTRSRAIPVASTRSDSSSSSAGFTAGATTFSLESVWACLSSDRYLRNW